MKYLFNLINVIFVQKTSEHNIVFIRTYFEVQESAFSILELQFQSV